MLALSEKSRDELLKESRLLYQKLNKQIKEIDNSKEPLLKDASNRFKELKKEFQYNKLKEYSDKRLKDLYRDLNYIDSLKSSKLEGAIKATETFGYIKRSLESLSEEKQRKFWDIYNRAYNNLSPTLIERFKYDVFNIISNEMLLGQDIEEIFEELREAFDTAYNEGNTEEERGELFERNLELLFSDTYEDLFDTYL